MNKYDLFDAMGGVDEDLLERSERKAHRRLPLRKAFIAAAAVMLLAVTVLATPGVQNWIFASDSEQVSDGIIREYKDGTKGWTPATFYGKLEVPNAVNAPEGIEEYRMPAYFSDNNWTIVANILFPDDPLSSAHFTYTDPKHINTWVTFEQDWLYSTTSWDTTKYSNFSIDGGMDGIVEEATVTIGSMDATLYITPPSEIDGDFYDPGRQKIVWSDGEYAYELETNYGFPVETIQEIILSLAPYDVHVYGTVDPNADSKMKPIETFYSLGTVPDGFALSMRVWYVNTCHEYWMDANYNEIGLNQTCKLSPDNDGPAYSVEDTLYSLESNRVEFTAEVHTVEGVEITIIRAADQGPMLMWENTDYSFCIDFNYDPGLTDEELLDYYRSVQPMPDFTDHLTDE